MSKNATQKNKVKILIILSIILILILFSAIYITIVFKYNNNHVRDLSSYKKISIELDNGTGYYGTLNNYYDYDSENLHSIMLLYDVNDDIYELLGKIKIKSKTKKASESEKSFNITYVPTYPGNRIMFQFHGDNIIIDGEEYKTEGLDEIRKYIDEHTLTSDDIITYASEDNKAINDKIKEAWHEGVTTDIKSVQNSLPDDITKTITAKLYFSYYLYATTDSATLSMCYPVKGGFYLGIGTYGTVRLFSVNENTEPLTIENNPDEVREFINENKTEDAK